MKFLYIVTKGAGDPTGASIPVHMAVNGSLEVGHDVTVLFAGDVAEVVVSDNAQTIEGIGVSPMRDLLAKLTERGAAVLV